MTREALRILHQKAVFIGSITRSYDSKFGQTGAQIGDTLNIRVPNQFPVRTGATLSATDVSETSVPLQISTQVGVDVNFTSFDLTLRLQDFSQRILEPAMSQLAAYIEADALNMAKDVYNFVDNDTNAATYLNVLQGRQKLNESLAPMGQRTALLNPTHSTKLADALKGLFNPVSTLSAGYREGMIGEGAGMSWAESSLLAPQVTGTAVKATTYTINGAGQTGASLAVATGATTFKKGDVITLAGCNRVHQESKADLGYLAQFVVTADYAGGAGNIAISPAITVTGAKQNVTASPTNTGAVTKVGAAASETYTQSLAYNKGAFAFATADLLVPKGVHFAAREVMDGISMRIVQNYDITNDKFPCRIDVAYGYKTIRPELAARIHADG